MYKFTASHKKFSMSGKRKLPLLSNIRDVQRLVISYASMSELFSPSDIVVFYKLKRKYGDDANKRVHDAIKRLERRGVVERVSWGLYRLKIKIDGFRIRTRKSYYVGVSRFRGGYDGVFRIHVRGANNLYDFYVMLLISDINNKFALRFIESEIKKLFGSRFIRRLKRFVRRNVLIRGGVLGCHGRYGRRHHHLLPISYIELGYANEIGIDLFAHLPIPKMFVKMYFRRTGLDEQLDKYVKDVESYLREIG